jgi:hypothetical protein
VPQPLLLLAALVLALLQAACLTGVCRASWVGVQHHCRQQALQLLPRLLAAMQQPQLGLQVAVHQQGQQAVLLLLLLPACPCGCVGAWLGALQAPGR